MSETVNLVPCRGCGALVPDIPGPTHRIIGASPGCWSIFGEVNAREFADPRLFSGHKLTVDTYAVQHPGSPSPQAIQSVAGHLVSIFLVLERGFEIAGTATRMRRLLRHKESLAWLEPPDFRHAMTIIDVRGALDALAHIDRVRRWAQSVWQAWAPHHATIKTWADLP